MPFDAAQDLRIHPVLRRPLAPSAGRLALLDRQNPLTSDWGRGVRMVAGLPLTFDLELANDWQALAAKMDAPEDLSALTDDELTVLSYAGVRIANLSGGRDRDISVRVQAERFSRGFDSMGRAIPAAVLEIADRNKSRHLLAAEEAAGQRQHKDAA